MLVRNQRVRLRPLLTVLQTLILLVTCSVIPSGIPAQAAQTVAPTWNYIALDTGSSEPYVGPGFQFQNAAYGNGVFVGVIGPYFAPFVSKWDSGKWDELSDYRFIRVTFAAGRFYATNCVLSCDAFPITTTLISEDGRSWKPIKVPGGFSFTKIVEGPGGLWAFNGGQEPFRSLDGITWWSPEKTILLDVSGTPVKTNWFKLDDVVYGNGRFVASVSYDLQGHGGMAISEDGKTWKRTSADSGLVGSLAFGHGIFVFADASGRWVRISTDGVNWTETFKVPNKENDGGWYYHWTFDKVTSEGGYFLVHAYDLGTENWLSADGHTWAEAPKSGLMSTVIQGNVVLLTTSGAKATTPARSISEEISVVVHGKQVQFPDIKPQVVNNRTMIPVRAVAESLGAVVDWEQASETVSITQKGSGRRVVLRLGQTRAVIDSKPIDLDVPAQSIGGRTMVPVRFVAEAFGEKVRWVAGISTVFIDDDSLSPPPPVPAPPPPVPTPPPPVPTPPPANCSPQPSADVLRARFKTMFPTAEMGMPDLVDLNGDCRSELLVAYRDPSDQYSSVTIGLVPENGPFIVMHKYVPRPYSDGTPRQVDNDANAIDLRLMPQPGGITHVGAYVHYNQDVLIGIWGFDGTKAVQLFDTVAHCFPILAPNVYGASYVFFTVDAPQTLADCNEPNGKGKWSHMVYWDVTHKRYAVRPNDMLVNR